MYEMSEKIREQYREAFASYIESLSDHELQDILGEGGCPAKDALVRHIRDASEAGELFLDEHIRSLRVQHRVEFLRRLSQHNGNLGGFQLSDGTGDYTVAQIESAINNGTDIGYEFLDMFVLYEERDRSKPETYEYDAVYDPTPAPAL